MATTPTSNGFLSGVSDFFGSILDKAPDVITAINSGKNNGGSTSLDAYGRSPGQVGYGTATPPAGFQTQGLPAWVKPVAIGGAVLLGLGLLWKLFKK